MNNVHERVRPILQMPSVAPGIRYTQHQTNLLQLHKYTRNTLISEAARATI